jgi:hypothetical protein
VVAEEEGNHLKGIIHVYFCVHRPGIKHEESGIQWELWQAFKAFFQLKRASNHNEGSFWTSSWSWSSSHRSRAWCRLLMTEMLGLLVLSGVNCGF